MEAPKRAYSIEIEAGADTKEDLVAHLQDLVWKLKTTGTTQGVSGGASAGSHFKLTVDENMTHDKYFELNDKWLEENKDK